jgi:hypothetical protein
MLKCEFRGIPGEQKVLQRQFHIMDYRAHGHIINKNSWSQFVHPGTKISMSMIISTLCVKNGRCPRPYFSGKSEIQPAQTYVICYVDDFKVMALDPLTLISPECNLTYFPSDAFTTNLIE